MTISRLTSMVQRDSSPSECPHRPPCAGCPRFGEAGIDPAARDTLNRLAHAHGIPEVSVVSGKSAGFRSRARLAIRGRVSSPKIGLFEHGTHRVVHIPHCSVQHPLINRVAGIVRRALVDSGVTCYSDKAHLGIARYLQVVIERSSQTAQVVVVGNCHDAAPLAGCFELIRDRLGAHLHSLWFNANVEQGNTILGTNFQHIAGPPCVVERFGGVAVYYPPGAFGQSNLEIADAIIEHLRGHIPSGARLAEFYAGVGAIGLSLLDQVDEIRCNEVSVPSLEGLARGIDQLNASERAKVAVVAGPAGASIDAMAGAQVVIADPPRKGLDAELSTHLAASPPERFLYVSCGLQSLLEDVSRLTAAGKLRLSSLRAFNLIPFTAHVETVACFERTTNDATTNLPPASPPS